MSKIRINELARQLEIPSHAIIDMLPELGVSEKKTHSSSIDEDVAERLRARVQGSAGDAMRREAQSSVAVAEPEISEHHEEPAQPARQEPHGPKGGTKCRTKCRTRPLPLLLPSKPHQP